MPSGINRFTQRARRALTLAQEEAERMAMPVITSEHILIGLARGDDSTSQIVLNRLGITDLALREAVRSKIANIANPMSQKLELSEGSKKTLQYGIEEALKLGHHDIGTEHLFLGILRVELPDESSLQVLERFGVTADAVRKMVNQVLQEPHPEKPAPQPWYQPRPNPAGPLLRMVSLDIVRDNMHLMYLVPWDDLEAFVVEVEKQLIAAQSPIHVERAVGDFAVRLTFSNHQTGELTAEPKDRVASLTIVHDELNMTCLLPWHDLVALATKIQQRNANRQEGPLFFEGSVGAYIVSVNVTGES